MRDSWEMPMLRSAALKGPLVVAAGAAAAVLVAAGAFRTDLMVSRSFSKALDAPAALSPNAWQRSPRAAGATQSGDEGYWLTRSDLESPALFDKRLAVGDRITIAGRDGRERVLEVIDLRALGEPLMPAVAGTAPVRLLLVTCRIVAAEGEQEIKAPVRFVIEGDPAEPALPRPQAAPKA